MSTMVISNETFGNVANTLFFHRHYRVKNELARFKDWANFKKHIEALRIANVESYNKQYKHIEDAEIELDDFSYDNYKGKFVHDAATLKALHAIIYNIDFDKEEFDYTFINTAIEALTSMIIFESPEYKAAKWG